MIRYRYNGQMTPAAPFVRLRVTSPQTSGHSVTLPAQVDSGADRTVIPRYLVKELGLANMRELPIGGLNGTLHVLHTHIVSLQLHSLSRIDVEVVSASDENFVLLGRDFLNHYRVILDGPGGFLEIHE